MESKTEACLDTIEAEIAIMRSADYLKFQCENGCMIPESIYYKWWNCRRGKSWRNLLIRRNRQGV